MEGSCRNYGSAAHDISNVEENLLPKVQKVTDEEVEELDSNFIQGRITGQGRLRGLIILTFIACILVFLIAANHSGGLESLANLSSKPQPYTTTSTLSAKVKNEYSYRKQEMFPYPFLTDALLMEPHRQSTVTISGMTDETCSLRWQLTGQNSIASESFGGSSVNSGVFTVEPRVTGQYTLSASEFCDGSSSGRSLTQTVWVKYVRRELQSLNDVDREEFLDAFRTLWDVSTSEGKKKYGSSYKSLLYFAAVHNDAGGNSVCDQFHAGSGFMNNHMYLSAYLEQSLRLVNPRVSLHYMEYSKYFSSDDFQKHMANQLDGGDWTEILSAKYFGSSDPYTGEILDGRWAHSAIPYVDEDFFVREEIPTSSTWFPEEEAAWLEVDPVHLASPYGLLRSPWNFNPAEFTVRYNNVNRLQATDVSNQQMSMYKGSTCDDYETFIKTAAVGQSFETYLYEAEDNVHGKIHFTFGGAGGDHAAAVDDALRGSYGLTDDNIMAVARATQVFFKTYVPLKDVELDYEYPLECSENPWVDGALKTTALPGETGGPSCQCSSYYLESEESLDELITMWKIKDNSFLYDLDFAQRKEAMQLICGRMAFDGEMAGSGASTDPLFWVAHGAVERLFQRVVFEDVLTDKTYVNPKRNQCSGHSETGTKKWLAGYTMQDPSVDVASLTNTELSEILDPTGDRYRDYLDFVYEDAAWSWCDGFDSWFASK